MQNKTQVADQPSFELKHATNPVLSQLIVVGIDPDAPSPDDPYLSDVLHFLATDVSVKLDGSLTTGKVVAEWLAPGPLAGLHR